MALPQSPGLSRHASENAKAINKAMAQLDLSHSSSTVAKSPFPPGVHPGLPPGLNPGLQPQTRPRAKMISMSSQLGTSKTFGAADVKKKKKKRKTKRK